MLYMVGLGSTGMVCWMLVYCCTYLNQPIAYFSTFMASKTQSGMHWVIAISQMYSTKQIISWHTLFEGGLLLLWHTLQSFMLASQCRGWT
jgi:hypothetical protein